MKFMSIENRKKRINSNRLCIKNVLNQFDVGKNPSEHGKVLVSAITNNCCLIW